MILEAAILHVRQGRQHKFEQDFAKASKYISSINGYLGHTLRKCIERENQYLLLVDWDSVESHETGFRKSKAYTHWKELLHDYYDPFPTVLHYETVYSHDTT